MPLLLAVIPLQTQSDSEYVCQYISLKNIVHILLLSFWANSNKFDPFNLEKYIVETKLRVRVKGRTNYTTVSCITFVLATCTISLDPTEFF